MAGIEQPRMLSSQLVHHSRNGACTRRSDEQVYVVVHEHVSMQFALDSQQRFPQERQIATAIEVVEETGKAVVSPLHDVLRNAG